MTKANPYFHLKTRANSGIAAKINTDLEDCNMLTFYFYSKTSKNKREKV